MRSARRLAFVAVFVSLAWTTAPGLIEGSRRAFELRGRSPDERRAAVIGPFYTSVRDILQKSGPNEPLAVVTDSGPDLDAALFFAFYAYPRLVRIYGTLDSYRMDPKRPKTTVRIDLSRTAEARLLPYEEIRAEWIASKPIVYAPSAGSDDLRELVLPLVTSGEGPAPDVYTTEAAMENAGPVPARVTFTIHPSERSAAIELKPGQRRTWTDFVWETFGTMEVGWLEMKSDQPVRARFWFVNRGRRDADVMQPARWFRRAVFNVPAGGRLWVVNPHDRELPVRLNEGRHKLPPRAVIPLEWVGRAELFADDDWYAFVTWRDAELNTRFQWPEQR
jgi:hypothetical protein